MRAVWISRYGPPEVLEVRETPTPEPGDDDVQVAVKAAGLNFAEVMARQGLYPDAPKPPCIVGYEVAGEVAKLGKRVKGFAVGDRVLALCRFGGHADTVCIPSAQARRLPDNMSFEDAAALPVNYVTAYHLLFRTAFLQPNERLLVHMAAGGVGSAVLQLARTVSGVTIFGTASQSKHDYLKQSGCHHPIDYRTKDYAQEILRITNNGGVDVVLDPLGGKDWKKGYDLLRPAGRLAAYGFANMAAGNKRKFGHMLKQWFSVPKFSPMNLMGDNKSVSGVNMGHLWGSQRLLVGHMQALLGLYADGKIKPQIDSTFSFDDAAAAHRRLEDRKNIGKVLLIP